MSYEKYLKEKYKYFEKQLKSGSPSAADSLGRIRFLLEACDLIKKHDLGCDENGICVADISEYSDVFFAEIRLSTDIHENAISITFHLGSKYVAIPNCYFHGLEDGKEKADEWLKNYIKTNWEMLIRSDCNILNAESFEKTFEKISDIRTFEKALLILTGHGNRNRLHDAIRKDVGYAMQRLLERLPMV